MSLTRMEQRWARIALETIFPGSPEAGLQGIASMDIEGYLADVLRTVPFKSALGLRVALWFIALAPLFLLRRFVTIVGLAQGDRELVVSRLIASPSYPVRSLVTALKAVGAMLYAGSPQIRARMQTPRRPKLVPLRLHRPHAA
jgi:hypothetical protein